MQDINDICEFIEIFTKFIEHGDESRLIADLVREAKRLDIDLDDRQFLMESIADLEKELTIKSFKN